MHANVTRRSAIQWTGTAFALPVVQLQPAQLENGMPFTPKFVDLARNFTTVQGTGAVTLGAAVSGYTSLSEALSSGDQFYYCIQGVDKPAEREVGRGTMQVDGTIAREPVQAEVTRFTSGTKTIALVTAAEWFTRLDQAGAGGASIEAADRAALANAPSARGAAMLTERGREGLFAWDPADLSALVAGDAAQGMHVAPASDPTGASGAWVRKFDGPVNPRWFGIVAGDAGGGNGPGNSAAFKAMLATLRARAVNPATYYQGVEIVRFSTGCFEFAETIDITDATLIIEGADTGYPAGRGTLLKFPAGVTAIRVQRYNTSGASATDSTAHRGGDGTVIRNISLRGGFAGSEGEHHGIHLRARALIENVTIEKFEGDGIHGDTETSVNNTNNSHIAYVRIQECRNGIYAQGADSNIWTIIGADLASNRRWGVLESGFLGNSYFGCHAASNGNSTEANAIGASTVSYNGNRYGVIAGQEAGASTNAPSGTNSSNEWWYFHSVGGTHAQFPVWTSGMAYRAGGSYFADGPAAANVFNGCYHEGDQGKAQLIAPSLVIGGNLANHVIGTAGIIRAVAGGYLEASLFKSLGSFRAEGSSVFGSTSGGNLTITFDNGATSNNLTFRSTSGSTQTDGALITSRNQGMTLRGFGPTGGQGNVNLASGTTIVARSKSTGFNVLGGFSYQLNDVTVVGARKTGWATATGTATRSAFDTATVTVAELAERVKALIDDLHGNAGHGLIGT